MELKYLHLSWEQLPAHSGLRVDSDFKQWLRGVNSVRKQTLSSKDNMNYKSKDLFGMEHENHKLQIFLLKYDKITCSWAET